MGTGIQESTPLVYDGVRCTCRTAATTCRRSTPQTGALHWEYKRVYPEGVRGGTNRNLAIWGTTLIDAGARQHRCTRSTRAPASSCGRRRCSSRRCPRARARARSSRTARSSRAGSASPARRTSRASSRRTTRRPARSCGARARSRAKASPATRRWGDVPMEQRWHVGTWMVPSYDPELDRIYVGTSVTIPAPKFILGGVDKQHLYHNSTLALEPGRPARSFGTTSICSITGISIIRSSACSSTRPSRPIRAKWRGSIRRCGPASGARSSPGIPGKTGIVYTLDRETGEFLWARPTVMQNVVKNIDGATGKVDDRIRSVIFTRKGPDADGVPRHERREELAGRRVQPAHQRDVHADAEHVHERDDPRATSAIRSSCTASRQRVHRGAGRRRRSASCGRSRPRRARRCGSTSSAPACMSLAATGGGLVFGGDVAGNFNALDDTTGKVLWETNLGAPVSGYPVYVRRRRQAIRRGDDGRRRSSRRASRRVTPELTARHRRRASVRVRAAVRESCDARRYDSWRRRPAGLRVRGAALHRGARASARRKGCRFRAARGGRPRGGRHRSRGDGRPVVPRADGRAAARGARDGRTAHCGSAARFVARRAAEGVRQLLLRRHDGVLVVGGHDLRRHHRDRPACSTIRSRTRS